jgi:hypothetical protein
VVKRREVEVGRKKKEVVPRKLALAEEKNN